MSVRQQLSKFILCSFLLTSLNIYTINVGAEEETKAQEEVTVQPGLSKTPNISKDTELVDYEDYVMPDDYPQEIYNIPMDTPHYIAVDQETNRVLAAHDAVKPYPIASLSKIPAVYMAYKAIDEGKITMDTMVETPNIIADEIAVNPELSNAGLAKGASYSVKDLIHAIMLVSGNDATSSLLWHIYGSEQEAVKAVREQLEEWGIDTASYYTVSGAPNLYLPKEMWIEDSDENSQNMMSASDLALMTKYVIEDYPEILDVSSTKQYVFAEGTEYEYTMYNHNLMLPGEEYDRDAAFGAKVTGLKSGFTDRSGRCFITTSVEPNGRKTITVVLGIQDPYNSYEETATLLNNLVKFEDLYTNENLPTIIKPTREERLAIEAEEKAKEMAEKAQDNVDGQAEYPNRRDSAIVRFIDKILNIFRK